MSFLPFSSRLAGVKFQTGTDFTCVLMKDPLSAETNPFGITLNLIRRIAHSLNNNMKFATSTANHTNQARANQIFVSVLNGWPKGSCRIWLLKKLISNQFLFSLIRKFPNFPNFPIFPNFLNFPNFPNFPISQFPNFPNFLNFPISPISQFSQFSKFPKFLNFQIFPISQFFKFSGFSKEKLFKYQK